RVRIFAVALHGIAPTERAGAGLAPDEHVNDCGTARDGAIHRHRGGLLERLVCADTVLLIVGHFELHVPDSACHYGSDRNASHGGPPRFFVALINGSSAL